MVTMESDVRPLKRLCLQEDIENISIGEHLFFYCIEFPVPLFTMSSQGSQPLHEFANID